MKTMLSGRSESSIPVCLADMWIVFGRLMTIFSMGLRSGDQAGHGSDSMKFSRIQVLIEFAACAVALSFW